jgi:hypothetical protein
MEAKMTTNLNFNDAGAQRCFAVIPAHTTCVLQMTIRPGGGGDDGWLTEASDHASQGLDCEYTVVEGEYANRKLWQRFTLEGTKPNHAEAGRISRNTIRAMIESARGIRPDDASDEAKAKRTLAGWDDLNGLRFMARLGVKPPEGNYPAKNTLMEVITPEQTSWKAIDQPPPGAPNVDGGPANATASQPASSQTPANAIVRPDWAG